MRCNCNPSRTDFGGWQSVCRCSVCGRIFQRGERQGRTPKSENNTANMGSTPPESIIPTEEVPEPKLSPAVPPPAEPIPPPTGTIPEPPTPPEPENIAHPAPAEPATAESAAHIPITAEIPHQPEQPIPPIEPEREAPEEPPPQNLPPIAQPEVPELVEEEAIPASLPTAALDVLLGEDIPPAWEILAAEEEAANHSRWDDILPLTDELPDSEHFHPHD